MEGENSNNNALQKKIEEEKIGNKDIDDEDSSEWSLASLEELKALNLRDLQENQEPMEHHPKEKAPIEVKFPEKPTVLPNAPLHQVGKIIFIVGELLIVESIGGAFVVDLENWICDENRNIFGFIIDVFGKIDKPYYSIKPEVAIDFSPFIGQTIYYIEGSSKILRDEDIKSMKSKSALQAEEQEDLSSDEENIRIERDFSDEKHERKKSPPRRINKFRDNDRNEHHRQQGQRDRTREQHYRQNRHNNNSRGRNEQNQRYLHNMYSMHYNQMMRLYNGQFDPNNLPPMQNPYINQNRPQNTIPHNNIAQFGGNSYPGQFYGQSFPQNSQPQMGLFPQQGQPQPQTQGLFHPLPHQVGQFPTNPSQNPGPNPYNNGRQ